MFKNKNPKHTKIYEKKVAPLSIRKHEKTLAYIVWSFCFAKVISILISLVLLNFNY